jgi:hypothetical protein
MIMETAIPLRNCSPPLNNFDLRTHPGLMLKKYRPGEPLMKTRRGGVDGISGADVVAGPQIVWRRIHRQPVKGDEFGPGRFDSETPTHRFTFPRGPFDRPCGRTQRRGMLSFFLPRPISAAAALDRIELLAVKSLHELLRVRWLLKAIDVKPLAVVM